MILPLAGFTGSRGNMDLIAAVLWAIAGSVAGALALYYVGALLGRRRMRAIAARIPLVKVRDLDRTEAWFARHGVKAVFFGRMIPLFRSFISIPAGIERMRMPTFVIFTTLGSAVWNTAFVLTGYLLGERWWIVEQYIGVFSKVVLAMTATAVVCFVLSRAVAVRDAQRDTPNSESPTDIIPAHGPTHREDT